MSRPVVLLLLVVASGIALATLAPRLVDQARLQEVVRARLADRVDGEAELAGVALRLLPRPALTLTGVRLAAPDFTLTVDRAELDLRLAALTGGVPAVAAARLTGARARFASGTQALEALWAVARHPAAVNVQAGAAVIGDAPPLRLDRVRWGGERRARRFELEGAWRERDFAVAADLTAGGGAAVRLERVVAESDRDRLVFEGRLDRAGAVGAVDVAIDDVRSLRHWLPRLPLPPALDAVLAAVDGPAAEGASLEADAEA